jgi:hypothetical protein
MLTIADAGCRVKLVAVRERRESRGMPSRQGYQVL